MRWLIVADDFPPAEGGVATWGGLVADGLHAAGDEVTVLARARPGLERAYPVIGVPGPSFGAWGGWWTAAAALGRKADRVLATTWPVATALARWREIDVVVHGSDVTRPPADPRGFERVMGRSRRFATSRFLAETLAARGYEATVLPAPIDAGPARPAGPEQPLRWGFLGRATDLKGGDRFVRLVAAAGAEGVVIGDGPALLAWREEALRCDAKVRFCGHLPRAEALAEVATWDLAFLLPKADADGTGAEGFGLSLVEAAALGVATVGSRVGGVPEAVGAGLVLEDPDNIPRAMAGLLSWWTPERGEACRAHVAAHHGLARTVEALSRPRPDQDR